MFNFLELFRRKTMNIPEAAIKHAVISLLKNLEDNHKSIINMITLGKLDPSTVEAINDDIRWTLKTLHPLIDVAHDLIPESMTSLHTMIDWAQEIYHQVVLKEKGDV
jgi:hypothetical protein